jgi:hypothetical protein
MNLRAGLGDRIHHECVSCHALRHVLDNCEGGQYLLRAAFGRF